MVAILKPLYLTQYLAINSLAYHRLQLALRRSASVALFLLSLSINTALYFIVTATHVQSKTALSEPASTQNYTQQRLVVQQAKVLAETDYNLEWFTQGLYTEGDTVYISSGLYGRSALIKKTNTPAPIQLRHSLNKRYFAEGLTVIGDTLYLLTWKENELLLFDKKTLKPIGKKTYQGEGWGLTHMPKTKHASAEFIMSNGSDTLSFRDIDTFSINRQLKIDHLNFINELEYVDGTIWANRWYDNHLYGISSKTGCIIAKVDLLPLRKNATKIDNKNVVNGVSYDKKKKGLWVTGKLWSKRFLIKMPEIEEQVRC